MPDFDALSEEFGAGTAGTAADSGSGGDGSGGRGGNQSKGGNAGKGGSKSGGGNAGTGAGTAGTGGDTAGTSGAGEGGEPGQGGTSGNAGAGDAGETQGGSSSGSGGKAGSSAGGTDGGGTGGTGGTGGNGGTGGGTGGSGIGGAVNGPCIDGCVLLYVPGVTNFQQFFTINLNLADGLDLSTVLIQARVRAIDFAGTSENVQFYASATPGSFSFYGAGTVPLSTMANGVIMSMDLTNTGGWDHTDVISFGFLIHGASSASPASVQLLVEDIVATVKADPPATPPAGPWAFTMQSDVNENNAEDIPGTYNVQNVIFANPYSAVVGARAVWVPPGEDGNMGGAAGAAGATP